MKKSYPIYRKLYRLKKEENLKNFVEYIIEENNINKISSTEILASKEILSACISYLVLNICIQDQTINNVIKILSLDDEVLELLFNDAVYSKSSTSYFLRYKKLGDITFRKNVKDFCIMKLCSLYSKEQDEGKFYE